MSYVAMEETLGIDFPFQLVIRHPGLDVRGMFELSKMLDFHEVRPPDPALGRPHHDLIVDVLYVRETETRIEIRPRLAMTYEAIATELDSLLEILAQRFHGNVSVTAVDWIVARKGVASDADKAHRRIM